MKPGTDPGFLLILHSGSPANPGLSLGRRAAQKVYVKRVYVPFSLAREANRKGGEDVPGVDGPSLKMRDFRGNHYKDRFYHLDEEKQ